MGGKELSREDIEQVLPHRRPFLFLESAVIVEPGKRATGKLTDLTHPDFSYLRGHFPGLPIFPGALLMETLAELAGVAAASSDIPGHEGKVGVLTEDQMKYRQAISPAEAHLVDLEAEIITLRSRGGSALVRALKEGKLAVEGEITFLMVDRSKFLPQSSE